MKLIPIEFNLFWARASEPSITYKHPMPRADQEKLKESLTGFTNALADLNNDGLVYEMNRILATATSLTVDVEKTNESDLLSECVHGGTLSVGIHRPTKSEDGFLLISDDVPESQINYYGCTEHTSVDEALAFCIPRGILFNHEEHRYTQTDISIPCAAGSELETLLILSGFEHINTFMSRHRPYLAELIPRNVHSLMAAHGFIDTITELSW